MRCLSCNNALSDFESTRKYITTDGKVVYIDICNKCLGDSDSTGITFIERYDLAEDSDYLIEDND